MRLAIIGSRDFNFYYLLDQAVRSYFPDLTKIKLIVSGGARGADKLGAVFAKENNILLDEKLPNWDLYGKRAGFIRNEQIIENCDVVIAFWDGVSKGTGNSLSIAKRLKKPTIIVYF